MTVGRCLLPAACRGDHPLGRATDASARIARPTQRQTRPARARPPGLQRQAQPGRGGMTWCLAGGHA